MARGNPRVAVIGAGLSGLVCASELVGTGFACVVFDKGRSPGGRSSTRRRDGHQFDHGATHFTATDPRFQSRIEVAPRMLAGAEVATREVCQIWAARFGGLARGEFVPEETGPSRYVFAPGMGDLAGSLATRLNVRTGVRCRPLSREGSGWQIRSDAGDDLGVFDAVVVTAPPEQSAELAACCPEMADRVAAVRSRPCWAVMAAFDRELPLEFDAAAVTHSPVAWAAREGSKPGREIIPERWVLHASAGWSEAHLEEAPESITPRLLNAFAEACGRGLPSPTYAAAHRWRYANPANPLNVGCLFDAHGGLAACGDWCHGGGLQGAFLSGLAAADRVARHLGRTS